MTKVVPGRPGPKVKLGWYGLNVELGWSSWR